MIRATVLGACLALAFLAAIGTPIPRLIGIGCTGAIPVKLAREESELPICDTIRPIPWAQSE